MIPKKSRELANLLAQEIGCSESLVNDATDFYWKEIRKSLSDIKSPNIYVAGLGTFVVSAKKLASTKLKYTSYIEKLGEDTFKKFSTKKELEDRIANIDKVFESIRENVEKKKQIRLSRNGKSDVKGSLEE